MKTNKNLISIVIATHNRAVLLREAIVSVCRQTLADWELIVVDDASTDETAEIVGEFDEARLRFFRLDEHGERSAARNLGLSEARGEFIMFLDDDDLLRSTALQILRPPLLENPDAVAAVGAQRTFLANGFSVRYFHPRKFVKCLVWRELIFGWSSVSGQNLYRTETVRAAQGFADEFIPCEDRQLWLKVSKRGAVCFAPPIVLEYRCHAEQTPRPANIGEIREAVYAEFCETLAANEKREAAQIRRAARFFEQAETASANCNFGAARRLLANSFQAYPPMWLSPLVGTRLRYNLKNAVFGRTD